MALQKMTINRALVELKNLDDRINKAITSGTYAGTTIGQKASVKPFGVTGTLDDLKAKIQGSFDRVDALIKQREVIKAAVVLSNAKTTVTILGRDVTVAEAIELKKTVALRTDFMNAIKVQLARNRMMVDKMIVALDTEIEANITTIYGGDKKSDAEAIKMIVDTKRDLKQPEVFDPAKAESRIEALEKQITDLSSELNFVLSDSNSQTHIEVEM